MCDAKMKAEEFLCSMQKNDVTLGEARRIIRFLAHILGKAEIRGPETLLREITLKTDKTLVALNDDDIEEIEKSVSKEKPQYDNQFLVIPHYAEKKIIITPLKPDTTLKIGVDEATLLIQIIQGQIQEWK
jgi:hypothetical protein